MEFYRMRGPSSPSTSSQFSFDLKNVQAGEGANKTTKDYFRLIHHSSNEVTIALVRSIQGPQDIELDLKMQYTYNGAYVGYSISKIFMYISQYDFWTFRLFFFFHVGITFHFALYAYESEHSKTVLKYSAPIINVNTIIISKLILIFW